jgi:hypothetical protein
MRVDNEPGPVSDRALMEQIAADLAHLRAVLAQWEPLLALLRGAGGQVSYVQAAGMTRAMRKARARAGNGDQ